MQTDYITQYYPPFKQKYRKRYFKIKNDPPGPIGENDIISYAYLFKQLSFSTQFKKKDDFQFNKKTVKGFETSSQRDKLNVKILEYVDRNKFSVRLKTQDPNTEIYLIKATKQDSIDSIVRKVTTQLAITDGERMRERDRFAAPTIHYNETRSYDQLMRINFKNLGWKNYFISQMIERVKFDMNETRVRLENQASTITKMSLAAFIQSGPQPRIMLFDSPFWIVLKEKEKRPFFVSKVINL